MEEQTSQIIQSGSVTMTAAKHVIHCLTIVGQIEGHYILPPQNKTTKYEHVIPQLVAIEQDPSIEGLMIILNTVGGDVEAGLAIAELISGMKKPTVSLVLGGGHSIGVPLACSAKQSFIAPSATMTVHPVRMNGLVLGVPQTLSYFDRMQERIVRFVTDNSGISSKDFRRLMMNTGELVMDVGTVLDGEKAVQAGLIDHLGGLSEAISCLYRMIEKKKREQNLRSDPKRRAQTMILHSVTPIWAMQQMMAEQSEQPTTVFAFGNGSAARQDTKRTAFGGTHPFHRPARFSAAGAFPGKTGEAAAKKQIFFRLLFMIETWTTGRLGRLWQPKNILAHQKQERGCDRTGAQKIASCIPDSSFGQSSFLQWQSLLWRPHWWRDRTSGTGFTISFWGCLDGAPI